MDPIIYSALLSLFWLINFCIGTEFDNRVHILDYTKIIVIAIFIIAMIMRNSRRNPAIRKKFEFNNTHIALFLWMIIDSFVRGRGISALEYLWVFCLVILLSEIEVKRITIYITSFLYGTFGIAVLLLYNYSSIFSGWNENSVAMIGFHSILVFMIPFYKKRKWYNKILLIVATAFYIILVLPTNSRSCIWFAILAFSFAFGLLSPGIFIGTKKKIMLWLIVPLILAIFITLISSTSWIESINTWSVNRYQKTIFNGRDEIWRYGFELFFTNPIFGMLVDYNYHNSAVAVLAYYGAGGYILWIKSFSSFLNKGIDFLNDEITAGIIVSFLALYLQQSVELGLFSLNPEIIPYILLGLLLGRIKTLKGLN